MVSQILEDGLSIRELGPEELGTAEKQPVTTELRLRALHCVCSHLEHRVIREGEARLYKGAKYLRRYRTKMETWFPGRRLVESFVLTKILARARNCISFRRNFQPISDQDIFRTG